MKRKNVLLGTVIAIVLILMISVVVVAVQNGNKKKKDTGEIIVKDHVYTITEGNEFENALSDVSENQLVFDKNLKYKKGDIIVAGIIDEARDGFIRKVIKTEKKDDRYIVETEPAFLTDVFEKAHVVKTIRLTENGVKESDENSPQVSSDNPSSALKKVSKEENTDYSVMKLSDTDNEEEEDKDLGASFHTSFEEDINNITTIRGEAGFDIWLELELEIANGDIVFGIVAKNETGAELHLTCSEEMEKEIERVVFQKRLPRYEFKVSGIPIVLTNELETVLGAGAEMEGSIEIDFDVSSQNAYGFIYDSRKGKVSEIKEDNSDTNGLNWNTAVQVTGTGTADVSLHLITKLYGSTGVDMGIGVQGKATGEAKLSAKPDIGGYAGRLELAIAPKVDGTLVVEVPVIDEKLAEQELFEKELKPFWEEEWKSSHDWKADLEWSETGEKGKTYITRFGEVNAITYPAFQFDIPFGWEVTAEEVRSDGETVAISNNRGVTVTYSHLSVPVGDQATGGSAANMLRVEATEVAESSFKPGYVQATDHSDMGRFVVAKLKTTGELDMMNDSDFTEIDGRVAYAVIPESQLGIDEAVRNPYFVEYGFNYSGGISLIAEAPEDGFTEREEKQVIEILQSFRVAE